MKIICKHNYDRESRSDVLVADHVTPAYGVVIVEALHNHFNPSGESDFYYLMVPEDYQLYVYNPV